MAQRKDEHLTNTPEKFLAYNGLSFLVDPNGRPILEALEPYDYHDYAQPLPMHVDDLLTDVKDGFTVLKRQNIVFGVFNEKENELPDDQERGMALVEPNTALFARIEEDIEMRLMGDHRRVRYKEIRQYQHGKFNVPNEWRYGFNGDVNIPITSLADRPGTPKVYFSKGYVAIQWVNE